MKQLVTRGIILSRTDFGEADRIITVLTPEQGKLRLMARGVRRIKSKLAGGIELFSTSDLTYTPGRGDIGTLISSRLDKHYGAIVTDIARVQMGYDLIKLINRATEDSPEPEYYDLLEQAFQALDIGTSLELIRVWFEAQLLRLGGHSPNLYTDTEGQKLSAVTNYNFDFESVAFTPHERGNFSASHIKTLRLLSSEHPMRELQQVGGLQETVTSIAPLLRAMLTSYIRI